MNKLSVHINYEPFRRRFSGFFKISYLHFGRICYIILLGKVIPCHSALGHSQNVHRSEYIKTPTVVSLSETVVWGSRTSAPLPGFEAVCSSPY